MLCRTCVSTQLEGHSRPENQPVSKDASSDLTSMRKSLCLAKAVDVARSKVKQSQDTRPTKVPLTQRLYVRMPCLTHRQLGLQNTFKPWLAPLEVLILYNAVRSELQGTAFRQATNAAVEALLSIL